jgi:SAM-dependent methyltransferase
MAGLETALAEAHPQHATRAESQGGKVVRTTLARLAEDAGQAAAWDLIVDHYLLAHVRRPAAMLANVARLLAPGGTAVLEFDHLLPTLQGRQVDAIRHGHRSYLSLTWLSNAASESGLAVTDLLRLPVYGGSLRVFMRHANGLSAVPVNAANAPAAAVARVLADEREAGLATDTAYLAFADDVRRVRDVAVRYLRSRRDNGVRVLAYGAPARATTLLNWYRIGPELIAFTADASPAKQGRLIPGVCVPIRAPADLVEARPNEILILAWDIALEVMGFLLDLGVEQETTRFVVPVPEMTVISPPSAS